MDRTKLVIMKISEIISENRIFFNIQVNSQSSLFKEISLKISNIIQIRPSLIQRKLNEREKLGATSVGNGIAIPHAKISGINKIYGFFFKLSNFVQFDNDVSKKVNLIFVIIAPLNYQSEHLVALSSISNFLKIQDNVKKLREEQDLEKIKLLFTKN